MNPLSTSLQIVTSTVTDTLKLVSQTNKSIISELDSIIQALDKIKL